MADRLSISDWDHCVRIVWIVDDDEGAWVGDSRKSLEVLTQELKTATDKSDREFLAVEIAALESDGVERDERGCYWESKRAATEALKRCRVAMKNLEHPWPAWAVTAKANGWSPPKGWKP